MGQSPEPYPPKVKRETDWLGGMSIALKCQDAGTSRNFQHPLGETLGCLVTFFHQATALPIDPRGINPDQPVA